MPKAPTPPREEKGPKRPPNAWILFRSDMNRVLRAQNPKMTQSALSKQISELWQSVTPQVRGEYERKAEAAKLAHQLQYPDYKFAPRKKEEIAREKAAKQLAKEERAKKSARNNQRAQRLEETKTPALYPTLADFGPLGPSPPGSAAGSPPDLNFSREASPAHVPVQVAGPSQPRALSPTLPDLSLPGPSKWADLSSQPDTQICSEGWQTTNMHSMLAYDLPQTPSQSDPSPTSTDLTSWNDSLNVVLMGTGEPSIFQPNLFNNTLLDESQSLNLNISMGELDPMSLFGTTPWDFNQTVSQNPALTSNFPDFAASNALSQTSPYDMDAETAFALSDNPWYAFDNIDPTSVAGSASTVPSTPSQSLDQPDTRTSSYVPPSGASDGHRRVGSSWTQFSLAQSEASSQAYTLSAVAQ